MPFNIEEYMRSCTAETCQETIKASITEIKAIKAQKKNETAWITALVRDADETYFPEFVPELVSINKWVILMPNV